MKNIISKMVVLGAAVGTLASCNIERFPLTSVAEDTFYASETEVELALLGAYAGLPDVVGGKWEWTELRADNVIGLNGGYKQSKSDTNFRYVDISNYDVDDITDGLDGLFADPYVVINRCNIILANLDACKKESIKTQLEAEAKTLRAMMYFDLVRFFGDTWYVTSNISGQEALKVEKSSVETIMTNMIADLEAAIPGLPKAADQKEDEIGRFTQEAARALLGKIYLTNKDYAKVVSTLKPVVDLYGTTDLVPFNEIFTTDNEMNKEILFAVRYKTGNLGLGSNVSNTFSSSNNSYNPLPGGGDGRNAPVDEILDLFGVEFEWQNPVDVANKAFSGINNMNEISPASASEDLRAAVTISYDGNPGGLWYNNCKFYSETFSTDGDSEVDTPVLRYGDVLLMYAEALNETTGAASAQPYINAIRTRAGLADVTTTDATEMHKAILAERRLELAFESERFFDLQREGMDALVEAVNRRNQNPIFYVTDYDTTLPKDITASAPMYLPIPFGVTSLY